MPPLKSIWAFIKRNPKKSIVLPILFYAIIGLITAANSTTGEARDDCKEMTEHYGGGLHRFDGQDYNFIICGKSFYSRFGSTADTVRLQVFDAQNELWVERFLDVDWSVGNEEVSFSDTSVMYSGANDDGVDNGEISMPPSRWEWIKVRVKHAFWRGMEFIFVKPVEWVFSS
jgi:hypothetical protein